MVVIACSFFYFLQTFYLQIDRVSCFLLNQRSLGILACKSVEKAIVARDYSAS